MRALTTFHRNETGADEGMNKLLIFAMVALPTYFSIVSRLSGLELVKVSYREAAATFARLMLDGLRQPGGPAGTAGANGTSSRRKRR